MRLVRPVGVDEDDDVAGRLVEGQAQRLAFAFAAVEDDARAVLGGDLRACGRASGRRRPAPRRRTAHRVDDLADQPFFILGRNDNGDTRIGHRLGWPVAGQARTAV